LDNLAEEEAKYPVVVNQTVQADCNPCSQAGTKLVKNGFGEETTVAKRNTVKHPLEAFAEANIPQPIHPIEPSLCSSWPSRITALQQL